MYLFLQLCLLFANVFSEALDKSIFLLMPEEYDRKFIFGDNKLGLNLIGNISYYYFSKPSLLAKSCNTFQYVQQIYDLVLGYTVEDYLLAKVDLRSRILWGSNQDLIDSKSLKFLGTDYGDHDHDVENKNFFWLREGWVNLDLSRFMGLTRSVNLTIGTIPYMVGRGISYGVVYSELPGFIGADSGAIIEEFAPAVLLSMELYSNKNHTLFGDLYCAILDNWSGSLEENIEPIYEKRIWHCPDKPERGFGHINTAMVAQLKYEAVNKYGLLQVQPYILCNLNPENRVILDSNLFDDYLVLVTLNKDSESLKLLDSKSSSRLITLGCMINWRSEKFCFNFEWAINKGGLKIYGRDKNNIFILPPSNNFANETQSIINIVNDEVYDYNNPLFALVNDTNQPIIEESPQGPEYNGQNLSSQSGLVNSFKRFINPKQFDYQGAMAVADFAYWLKPERLVLAFTIGFATGGNFELLSHIYAPGELGPDPSIDDSGSYGGFISLQELYTGLWVQSAFGMGGPFLRKSVANPTDFYSGSSGLFFKELFNDIKFLGLSMNFFPNLKSSLSFNINYFWSFCTPLEVFFPNESEFPLLFGLESNNQILSKDLGLEIFLLGKYELLENLGAFLAWAIFFPGSRYFENITPLDFFDNIASFDFYQNFTPSNPDTAKFNPVYLFNTGFEYSF